MGNSAPLRLQFDAFELDEADARLTRVGQPIALPPKAFAVLCTLARQPGQLVTKDALLDAVWGHRHVSESVLKTMISALRAALSDDAKQPRYIETASRRGYRFIGAAGPLSAREAVSLPPAIEPASASVPGPPIIGRHVELERLRASWRNAIDGRRQIVWVAGEPGVGKTTLIDGFVASLGDIACAYGQCVEQHGAGEPYLPVLEALGTLCRSDAVLVSTMRTVAPTWLLQLPWLSSEAERETLRRDVAGASQERMLRELGELLDRYTQQRPLLLVTEDLHWSDHATVHLIDHIARRRSPARLLWLASFRLAEVISEDHPLKALRHELRLHRLSDEIVLDPFSEREVAEFMGDRLPDADVSEAFVRVLHAHTDGLPLFVVNVIDDLIAQGGLHVEGAEAVASASIAALQVPENLAGVIEKQIARLSAELRTLLEAASVCGVEFRPATVAAAMAREVAWVQDRCDELARQRRWLSPVAVDRLSDGSLDARYAFRHALYRHVFYQRIGALLRAQLHGQVANSMERSRGAGMTVTAAELASHFELSHELMTALRYYAEAAENALRLFAPTEAVNLTTRALALLPRCPDGRERMELELALVTPRSAACTQLYGVSSPLALAAFERVHALSGLLPAKDSHAMALIGLGWVSYARGQYADARALGERFQAVAETTGDRVLNVSASNLIGGTAIHQGEPQVGRQWLENGLEMFAALAEQLAKTPFVVDHGVSMHSRLSQALAHLGFPDRARAQIDAATARAAALGHPFSQMLALYFAGLLELRLDCPERVLELAETLGKNVRDNAYAQGQGPALWLRGWALTRTGQADAGHALILEGYEVQVRTGTLSGCSGVLGHAAEALIVAQRWADAHKQLEEALALAEKMGERIFLPDLRLLEGRIALGMNRPSAARGSMQAALDEARRQQALWLELNVLVALCESKDAAPADLETLRAARSRLGEGFDTALITKADQLLRAGGLPAH